MSSPSSSQVRLTGANVIKWTEVLPRPQNTAALAATGIGAGARRRRRRALGPPPGTWPLPGPPPIGPLPDPALAQLCAVPDAAPPYDDQIQRDDRAQENGDAGGVPAMGQEKSGARADRKSGTDRGAPPGHTTRIDRDAPPDRSGRADRRTQPAATARAGGPSRADAVAQADSSSAANAGSREGSGDPAGPIWPSQFAQVLAETLAGSRPPRQLTPWTTQRARGHIQRLGPLLAANQEPRIRRIVASTPARGVVEMAVVVRFGSRVHALAVRLEREETAHQSAWQCTAIEAA
jgi:hypothetical protein